MTVQGRLVVSGSILAGVAIIPAQAAELVEALIDYQNERRQKIEIRRKKDQEAEWTWRRPQCDTPTEQELMNSSSSSSSSEVKEVEWTWRRPSCSTGACDVSTPSDMEEGNKSMNIISSAVDENNDPVQINNKPRPVCFNCGAEANVVDASFCWSCGSKLSCSSCGAESHRVDASFCWKCGDSLKKNSLSH